MNLKADTLYEHWKEEKDLKIVQSSEPLKALEVLGIHKLKAIHIIVVFFSFLFLRQNRMASSISAPWNIIIIQKKKTYESWISGDYDKATAGGDAAPKSVKKYGVLEVFDTNLNWQNIINHERYVLSNPALTCEEWQT